MAGIARGIQRKSKDRSTRSKRRPRAGLYEHGDATLAGSGPMGRTNACRGAGVAGREDPKWLRRFLVEGRYTFDEIFARSSPGWCRPRWPRHFVQMGGCDAGPRL